VPLPADHASFLKWRVRALEAASGPIEVDMVRLIPTSFRPGEFFEGGRRDGFFAVDDSGLFSLNKSVFAWAGEKVRTHFFESESGVPRRVLSDIAETQRSALEDWFRWFVRAVGNDGERAVPAGVKMSAVEIVDRYFRECSGRTDSHDLYGTPECDDDGVVWHAFILRDTYHPDLMKLFRPGFPEDARPRKFTDGQMRDALNDPTLFADLFLLHYNFLLGRGDMGITDELRRRGALSA